MNNNTTYTIRYAEDGSPLSFEGAYFDLNLAKERVRVLEADHADSTIVLPDNQGRRFLIKEWISN